MMNRDDVLRELELLPVWQLRASLKVAEPAVEKTLIAEAAIEVTTENTSLTFIISDDKKWIFAYPADPMDIGLQACTGMSESSGILFQNILHALKISKANKILLENISEAKVIIAMGETAAQQLLKTTESLEQLRGKTHTFQNIPLIVTYHPNDMLQYLPNKAKTWDDLCMGFSV